MVKGTDTMNTLEVRQWKDELYAEVYNKFYISTGFSEYLWHDGELHYSTVPDELSNEEALEKAFEYGWWETEEEAQEFLDGWLLTRKE